MRWHPLRLSLDCAFGVCRLPFAFFLFFFFFTRLWDCSYCSCTIQWTVAANFDFFIFFQPISAHRVLFIDLQISFFNKFFIKNWSHSSIYTFKNYFFTLFFSFQLYPNGPKWYCTNQILVTMWNGINKVVSTTKNHLVQYQS